jgi:hypothetical protein
MAQSYPFQDDSAAVVSYVNDMLKGLGELATASGCDQLGASLDQFRATCPQLAEFNGAPLLLSNRPGNLFSDQRALHEG